MAATVGDYGEKRLVAEVVRPIFDGPEAEALLGNDAALLAVPDEHRVLVSTDRIPADLIAFELGILDYEGLGCYLAYLNLSDIVSCGGTPAALLLTMGIPKSLGVESFVEICRGFRRGGAEFGCRVVGGDISSAAELSLSATAIGFVREGEVLRRDGARAGDLVFISKPAGITPAAFAYFLGGGLGVPSLGGGFRRHLVGARPSLETARALVGTGCCSSCMDNTDGLAQSLKELAAESKIAIVVEVSRVQIPTAVTEVATILGVDPLLFALGPGHDLGLVGTWSGSLEANASQALSCVQVIGRVEGGEGVFLEEGGERRHLTVVGWDYFRQEIPRRSSVPRKP